MNIKIRIDGLYKSPLLIDSEDCERYWRYLRFRNDGTVTMVHCIGTEEDVAQWIEDDKHLARGRYSIESKKISFWVKIEDDFLKTRFEGNYTENLLNLRMWNSNNDFDVTEVYTFNSVNIKLPKRSVKNAA